jgi:ATP-dependent DNA helicase RecG
MGKLEPRTSGLGTGMNAQNLKRKIAEGEGLTVEFKRCERGLGNSVFETLAAFSNRYGGVIFLGVNDDGTIRGVPQKSIPDLKKNFVTTLNNPDRFSPTLFLTLEEAEIEGKTILWVYVPVSSQLVLFGGKIYDRAEDGDLDITRNSEMVAQIHSRKSHQFSEREIFPYAKAKELELKRLMPLVRRLVQNRRADHPWLRLSDMDILRSAGLYPEDRATGKTGFNLAAILLFGREEVIRSCSPNYLTDAICRRENLDRYDDRLMVTCNLIEAYDQLIEFIGKHTLDKFFLMGDQSVSIRTKIARELVSNSLVHREYSSAFPAKIIVEKSRIVTENWNIPRNPGRIDPNHFTPYPKNPLLASFFVQIGRADTLGSGVRNLYQFTKIYSDSEPQLLDGDIFRVLVPMDEELEISDTKSDTKTGILDGTLDENGTKDGILEADFGTLDGTKKKILSIIDEYKVATYDDLAKRLGIPKRTLSREMSALQESGHLKRVGGKRFGHWEKIK